ncbi:hypothetical protein RB195_010356 [Necator americanus]|uniref:Reverse transcriptase domain-containing protein n=1 Tax=Necator americanus TaxID=51031 RepID=A0ABR1CYV5_NECAM
MESFDVTSLYTNVQNKQALQALSEMLDRHGRSIETYGLSKQRIMILINECLQCNIFKWSGKYFSQIRGLAMGQRLAPVLAVCFMSRIEQPVIERLPQMYCRYIDDCFLITSTQSEVNECFRILNERSQYIKLTREQPKDGWLPYLNAQIKLHNGIASVKWYRKGSSKNILINAKSAHPNGMKKAVIRNMVKTATAVCTGDREREESLKLATSIASSNGYSRLRSNTQSRTTNNTVRIPREGRIPLCIPFVSDSLTAAIHQTLLRAQLQDDVVLVNIPNDSIKRQLVRNRFYDRQCVSEYCMVCPFGKAGDCASIEVIYQIECLTCNAIFIEETGTMLDVRIKEHLAGKRRGSSMTPLGPHENDKHDGNEFEIKCTILAHEKEISARKALEAFWISPESVHE